MRVTQLLAGGALSLLAFATPTFAQSTARPESESAAPTGASLSATERVVEAAAQQALKSVVSVRVVRSLGSTPLSPAERFRLGARRAFDLRYFARPDGPCSGVVLAPGLVATCEWNLEGEGAVTVLASDGTVLKAKRAGRDKGLGVIVLKVTDPQGKLKPIQISTQPIETGRTAILVGRSESNGPIFTRGMVSGLKRARGESLTHSAKTNYANAGGALVDLDGKLIALSVRHSHRARQGQNSGVGFGARHDRVMKVLPRLAKGEVIEPRPTAFMGIGLDIRYKGAGVRIRQIIKGTGAEAAGMKAGDVVTIFNSVKIEHVQQLIEEIQKLSVGTTIVITVKRDGKTIDYTVKLGARPKGK